MSERKKKASKYMPYITNEQMATIIKQLPAYKRHKAKVPSINFHRDVTEKQNRDNYINEYHRLRGFITGYLTPGSNIDLEKKRLKDLTEKYNNSFISSGSLYEDEFKNVNKK